MAAGSVSSTRAKPTSRPSTASGRPGPRRPRTSSPRPSAQVVGSAHEAAHSSWPAVLGVPDLPPTEDGPDQYGLSIRFETLSVASLTTAFRELGISPIRALTRSYDVA